MLMITSDPQIKELLERGRKQRSDAFFGVFTWFSVAARPKDDGAVKKQAAPEQRCPN